MNKIFILFSLFFGAIVLCQPNDSLQSKINQLKMNQVQVIGSHNSYRLRMDKNLFKWFSRFDSTAAAELDYSHFPLAEQFSIFGIRQVELDVYYDPEGGLFDKRMGNIVCKDPLRLHNPDLLQPGLKVLHFPDIDYGTNYYSFTDALQEIKDWSEEHSKHLPIFVLIEVKDEGVPCESDIMKPDSVSVFTFPMKAPEGAILRNDRTAIEQLELWLVYQRFYCEHKPSVTISVKDHEWMEVGAWVYEHFDEVSGVSFLPHSDHTYQQAPYEDCVERIYLEAFKDMPKSVNWSRIEEYELSDTTISMKTMACTGSVCEMVDLTEEEREIE